MTFTEFYMAWALHYRVTGRPMEHFHYNGYGWVTEPCQS
jgi:lipopolysaccharide export system protein LptC